MTSQYADSALGHDRPTELQRLHALEQMWDPISTTRLARLPIRDDWRCLELGAGAGSLASWLASRTPRGHTVATDLDIRFLPTTVTNLRPLRHDVRHDHFPSASFDLIHTRALLEHVPQAEAVVRRMVHWLKPGGWLAIEGIDLIVGEHSPHPPIRAACQAMTTLMANQIGGDLTIGRRVPPLFAHAGLTEIAAHHHAVSVGAGGPAEVFFLASLDQLAPALIAANLLTSAEFIAVREWLASPRGHDTVGTLCWTSGRKPGLQAADG